MTTLKSLEEKLSKEDRKILLKNPPELLADFFNGVIIQFDEECIHES